MILAIALASVFGFSLAIGTTDALWSDSKTSTAKNVPSGQNSVTVNYSGDSITTTINVNATNAEQKSRSNLLTLNEDDARTLTTNGNIAIPIKITGYISGMASLEPYIKVSSKNWNGGSASIEPEWKIARSVNGTCTYRDLGSTSNLNTAAGSIGVNDSTATKNSIAGVSGAYNATTSINETFCLLGKLPVINCESGKTAIHPGYLNNCGSYTNVATVSWTDFEKPNNKGTAQTQWTTNKVTKNYDWSKWVTAIDKNVTTSGSELAPFKLSLGWNIVPYSKNNVTGSGTFGSYSNIPTL